MSPRAGPSKTTIQANNIHCASCDVYIREILQAWGMTGINVNVHSQEVHFEHEPSLALGRVCTALSQAGFEINSATTIDGNGERTSHVSEFHDSRGWWSSFSQSILPPPVSRRLSRPHTSPRSQRAEHFNHCDVCRREKPALTEKPIGAVPQMNFEYPDLDRGLRDRASEPVPAQNMTKEHASGLEQHRIVLSIGGMTCASCTSSISAALMDLDFVRDVEVSLMTNSAKVFCDGPSHSAAKLVEVVNNVGFEATIAEPSHSSSPVQDSSETSSQSQTARLQLSIGGMTCASCTSSIDSGLKDLPFVKNVAVSLMTNSATVEFSGTPDNIKTIVNKIEDLGYECSVENHHSPGIDHDKSKQIQVHRRTLSIQVDGLFCEHCPQRIVETLSTQYRGDIIVDRLPTLQQPVIQITYTPRPPHFTIRQIIGTINAAHEAFEAKPHRQTTIEQRSQTMQKRERSHILFRLLFSAVVAIPTLLIGVLWMSVVPTSNKIRRYFMQPAWAGNVSRAEWALLILATPVYFFAADIFHTRALKEIRALWSPRSKVRIARRFYRFGSMNLLISAGTSVAYISSLILLILSARSSKYMHSGTYFDSVVFLTFFILIGRYLEAYSRSKAGDTVGMLKNLKPDQITLVERTRTTPPPTTSRSSSNTSDEKVEGDAVTPNLDVPPSIESTRTVDADFLESGDVILVPRGSSPPADGSLLSESGLLDESSLTGESRSVDKLKGDEIYAGSINVGEPLKVRVTGLNGSSMLDRIIEVVREGQAKRAPVERIVDSLTAYFVPVVTALAVVTFVIWIALGYSGALSSKYLDEQAGGWAFWSLEFAIAVFVVACPCGIGLAAPTALFIGGGLAAKHGILVRGGGEAFEEASKVDVVVFDKTGTLTEGGDLKVTDHQYVGSSEQESLAWAIVEKLEESSNHPLAKAIYNCAQSKPRETRINTKKVSEIPGRGLHGTFEVQIVNDGESVFYEAVVGSEALVASLPSPVATQGNYYTDTTLASWKSQAKSVAVVALRQIPSASTTTEMQPKPGVMTGLTGEGSWMPTLLLAMSDPLRPSALPTIAALKNRGISTYMLTGDNPTTAAAVASNLSIPLDHVFAGVLPHEKATKIRWLQEHGSKRSTKGSRASEYIQKLFQRIKPSTKEPNTAGYRSIVAFVGDGINDAPALALSPVSISLESASSIAMTSSSFVLLNPSLEGILTLLDLSKRVFTRVKWNFAWALGYNVILIPIAAGVLFKVREDGWRLGPVWAAAAMALSSVSVVLASLALRWEGRWRWWRRVAS